MLRGGDTDGNYATSSWGYTYNDVESVIAPRIGQVEILHVNHHGSAHSSNEIYVNTLDPDVSLISCGYDNRHDHPAQTTLDRLLATSKVYLTEKCDLDRDYGNAVFSNADIIIKSSDGVNYTVNEEPYVASDPFVAPKFVSAAKNISGPRIPTAYFVTTGTGQSDEGIEPDPYETFSYDMALKEAGIENFNVVSYTSVLPPESNEVQMDKVKSHFSHGAVLESIMAKAGSSKGNTVAAGVGRVWAIDSQGKFVGGFAAEYERVYKRRRINPETTKQDAITQLTKSLNHILLIRGLRKKGEMKFDVTSLYIEKKYGMALAALGFVNFIYPNPLPIKIP